MTKRLRSYGEDLDSHPGERELDRSLSASAVGSTSFQNRRWQPEENSRCPPGVADDGRYRDLSWAGARRRINRDFDREGSRGFRKTPDHSFDDREAWRNSRNRVDRDIDGFDDGEGSRGLRNRTNLDWPDDFDHRDGGSRGLRKRLDHDADEFDDRGRRFLRYRHVNAERGMEWERNRSRDRERIHHSENFCVPRGSFPKGFRSQRGRRKIEGSVSSWNRYGTRSKRQYEDELKPSASASGVPDGGTSSRESLRSSHTSSDVKSPSWSRTCAEPSKDVTRYVLRNGASEVEEGELQLVALRDDNLAETVLAKEACMESETVVDEEEQLGELEAGKAEIDRVRNDTPAISESLRDDHPANDELVCRAREDVESDIVAVQREEDVESDIVTIQREEDRVENDVIVPQSEDIVELSTHNDKDKGKGVIICSIDEVEFGRKKSLFEQDFIISRKDSSEGANTRSFEFISCSNEAKSDKVNKVSHNEDEDENRTLEPLSLSLCLPNVSFAAPLKRDYPRPNSAPCTMGVQSLPTPLCTGSDGLIMSEEHIMGEESGNAGQKDVLESDFINSIVGCVVSEPIQTIAFKFTELADESIACLKEGVQEIITKEDQQTQFHSLQGVLNSRSDLTLETLIKSHRVQLEILVAIKTGMADFLRNGHSVPLVDLAEFFLNLKCRNPECGRELPVYECECKFCSRQDGFCSMCMCLVCSKFDSESNTCGWVGCDSCSHWCHTDCGLQKSYIRDGPSVSSAQGTPEMLFYCLACDHKSAMFGFVKEVFKTCAADWKDETMIKELEYIKRIFASTNYTRGKTLHSIAKESLVILNPYCREYTLGNLDKVYISGNVLSAYRRISSFLKESDSTAGSGSASSGQKPEEPIRRETPSTGPSPALNVIQQVKERVVDDEVETLVKMIQGEAKMLESRAEDARRKAEILKGIALRKRQKIDEEYTARMTKLHKLLAPAEEERRKKMVELQLLERSYQEYMKTQIRMREDITNLCRTMGKPKP